MRAPLAHLRKAPWLAVLALATACAAPIQHTQPVELPGKGVVQVAVGAGMSASSSALDLVDTALDHARSIARDQYKCEQSDRSDCLPAVSLRDEVRAIYAMGLAGGVAPWTDLQVGYGLGGGLALNGRLGGGQRLDLLWQAADGGPDRQGWQASLLVGYSHQTGEPPSVLKDVLDLLSLTDFSRHDAHLGLAAGKRLGDWGWWGVGGHYVLSRYSVDLRPELKVLGQVDGVSTVLIDRLPATDESGISHHLGGFAHVYAGWKHVWVGLELAASWYHARAMVIGNDEAFDGLQILPTLQVLTRW